MTNKKFKVGDKVYFRHCAQWKQGIIRIVEDESYFIEEHCYGIYVGFLVEKYEEDIKMRKKKFSFFKR